MKDCEFCTDYANKIAPKSFNRSNHPFTENEKLIITKTNIYLCDFHYKEMVINKKESKW